MRSLIKASILALAAVPSAMTAAPASRHAEPAPVKVTYKIEGSSIRRLAATDPAVCESARQECRSLCTQKYYLDRNNCKPGDNYCLQTISLRLNSCNTNCDTHYYFCINP